MARKSGSLRRRRGLRLLAAAAAVIGLLFVSALAFRRQLAGFARDQLTPEGPFEAQSPPPAPDYAAPRSWAALPDRRDGADIAPLAGTRDEQATARADVFFLYPGSNWTDRWNLPLDHWFGRRLIDSRFMPLLASVWNGCCRVYVPRLRQESGFLPVGGERDHAKAVDLAYGDVRRAFHHYLSHFNRGRPLIVAGANSGGRHALRLLAEEVVGTPIQSKLAAAYVFSAQVDRAARPRLAAIPTCDAPDQTGCINTWSALGRQRFAQTAPAEGVACVNPLSWRSDGAHVPREQNPGGIRGSLLLGFTDAKPQPVAAMADAECARGHLWVTPNPAIRDVSQPFGPGDYHMHNIAFFYASVRENAKQRVRAFLERCGSASPGPISPADALTRPAETAAGEAGCMEVSPADVPGVAPRDWPGAMPTALR
jgi:hypothetical protein